MAVLYQRVVVQHGAAQQQPAGFDRFDGQRAIHRLHHHQRTSYRFALHQRLAPIYERHGHVDSLRWPFLNAPVIHGRAAAVQPVCGSGGLIALPKSLQLP
jgi:hypothetical protein